MDFTLKTYLALLKALQEAGYAFRTFAEYLENSNGKIIILRHDVDKFPLNSLAFSEVQRDLGIRGSYYFRVVMDSWNKKIIRDIALIGHEIGYHYEDVNLIAARAKDKRLNEKDLALIAIENFKVNLAKLRELVPVKTICMHGSPLSRWDSRLLWKYFDYRDYGIMGEPYFDINFDEVLYLTDTGRRWDGDSFNVRDRAIGFKQLRTEEEEYKLIAHAAYHIPVPKIHSTFDIIKAATEGLLPGKMMMTFHPQRWTDKPLPWINEIVLQNIKNLAKSVLIRFREG
jgi:hypothetical protein